VAFEFGAYAFRARSLRVGARFVARGTRQRVIDTTGRRLTGTRQRPQ